MNPLKTHNFLLFWVLVLFANASFAETLKSKVPLPDMRQLYVGTCYQPVDRSPEQIRQDIVFMKQAGFTMVRIGDLSWDSFEPEEGKFDFSLFDSVMDQMHANGIKVIMDIPGSPAPLWLHRKYPGANLVDQNGNTIHPAERYMDNISDPDHRRLAKRLADKITQHYADHPALFAIGYNNEIGNGHMSYSSADRARFISWLKTKYSNLDNLNKAWATQRWSRKISHWDEVQIPYGNGPGPFERYLDLRRYWSDMTIAVLKDFEEIRRKNVPDKPAISNLWDTSDRKGFNYLSSYREYVNYGAMGYYAGDPISGGFDSLMMKGALDTPIWFNEFTAGGGGYYGTKNRSRMWAHFGLINGAQTILAWTFNSHLGGEEQALFGLIDHDDTPSWKLDEFATIAKEFNLMKTMGFPRKLNPEVAIAYSFEAKVTSNPISTSNTVKQYITTPYMEQVHQAFAAIYNDNIDVAVINIAHEDLSRYKLVIVPGLYLIDQKSADAIRQYVSNGGTVLMTAFSAKVNENNQWFNTPLPGRLDDVFGLKTNEFYHAGHPLEGKIDDQVFKTPIDFYEVLDLKTAKAFGNFTNLESKPAVASLNKFGKGNAIYVSVPANKAVMQPIYKKLYTQLSIQPGPQTPEGVYAREVQGRMLYVNTTTDKKEVLLSKSVTGVLSGKKFNKKIDLDAYAVEFVE
jgi:beta-galactosidase